MIQTVLGKKGHGKTTLAKTLLRRRDKTFCIIVDLFDQFKEYPLMSFEELIEHFLDMSLPRCPVRISIFMEEDFDVLCRLVAAHGNILLTVDEVDYFDSPSKCPISWRRLIHYSRHYCVSILTTSRRPANISRDLTSQTDEWYMFAITEPRDLKYMEDTFGSGIADKIRFFPRFKYILIRGYGEVDAAEASDTCIDNHE